MFAYLVDPSNLHEWDPRIIEVAHQPPGPLSIGTQIRETREILRRNVTQRLEVTELEEPVLVALRIIEGPLPMKIRTVLEPQGALTRVHVSATGELGGVRRVTGPVLARAAKRQLRVYYERLKSLLEARAE